MDFRYHSSLSILIVAGIAGLLFASRKMLFDALRRRVRKTAAQVDDVIIFVSQGPSSFLVIALGI